MEPIAEAPAMTFSDIFRFLDSGHGSDESNTSNDEEYNIDSKDDELEVDDEDSSTSIIEKNKAFWDNQLQVLKETLCKSSSMERAIRNAAKEAMKEAQAEGKMCICRPRPEESETCRRCLMDEISRRLRQGGYNSAVCKSKWRSSPEIPSGEHTYIDVLDDSNSKKGREIRVIIELNFRAEFEMARTGEEYAKLVARLPEAFVGKAKRLEAIVKILCTCAKKCMKDKKMHMGPWRKYKYMLAKWCSSTCQRMKARIPIENNASPNQLTYRPKASMLTVALLHGMPNMQSKAVEVV